MRFVVNRTDVRYVNPVETPEPRRQTHARFACPARWGTSHRTCRVRQRVGAESVARSARADCGGCQGRPVQPGSILTDQDGRTLYAFFNDKNGTSSCADQCVATWPALVSRQAVAADAGIDHKLLSQTTRAEGTVQATYGNWPLYYYVGDQGPGDIDGQGVDGVWFVIGTTAN
jgi:predicted lipoprotein with Yx(FWY)xxD motif